MAVFSTNQNRQLYVVKSVVENDKALKSPGDLLVCNVPDKDNAKQIYFKYMSYGGVIRTDLIDLDNICYAKLTEKEKLQRKLKKAEIKLNANVNTGNPIVGQDYIVRILIRNYIASGDDSVTIKHGLVHATFGMNAEAFYKKLAESLTMNFSREVQPLLTFKAETDKVTITEVIQPYVTGFMSREPVNFDIYVVPVRYQGDDVIWAEVDEKTGKVAITEGTEVVGNGSKIADLEYFCMGERGDQYRDYVAAPNRIPVKYMVDPEKEYDVIDMHYYFSDTGVNSYKSEKDITFVMEDSVTDNLKTKIGEAGVTLEGNSEAA